MGEICIEVLTKRNLVLDLPIPIALDSAGTTASDLLSAGLEARREVVEILAVGLVPDSPAWAWWHGWVR